MKLHIAIAESCRRLRRRWRADGEKGSAAIEFAMVAPVLFLFLFGIIETGVIFFGTSMLQNATDDTARQIRTGQLSGALTSAQLVSQVCSEVAGMISSTDCTSNLKIDLRSYTSFGGSSYPSVTKSDGTIDPAKLTVQSTADCKVVLLRSFYPWKIMTPLMSTLIANTKTGFYMLSSASAFRTEPYTSSSTC
ncbi:MAG TPA: TadE/TadG family type IV pilus assembly protein [Rhizomicrobium sp.]|jgi:Flp pilus assembly protein TadG